MWVRTTTITRRPPHTYVARGFDGQYDRRRTDLRLVVAVGSVATKDYSIPGSDVSFLLTDVILPALDHR